LISVPVGFVTDFASVPTFIKSLIDSSDPDVLFASVIHDFIYARKGKLPNGKVLTRLQADSVLREAMEVCGAPKLKSNIVFDAVRSGGLRAWSKGGKKIKP
jgi:hypothetical protein